MKRLLLLLFAFTMLVCEVGATRYSVTGRATSPQTGKKYMIYNTARRYFLSASGSGYSLTNNTAPLSYSTFSSNYIWELETGTETGTYKIKNVGTSTYSAGGTTLSSTATDYTIAEFSTCPSKGGMASYNDDSTTKAAASITSTDNTVYIVAYGTTAYWNGTESAFSTYKAAHVYVLYEVSEADIPLEDGLYTLTYSKESSYTSYMKPDFTFTNTKKDASATAADGGVFKFTLVSGTTNTYYIQSLVNGGYLYANGLSKVTTTSPYEYHDKEALSNNSSFDSNDGKFKWKLVETNVGSGKYYIKPSGNDNTAIAVYSDNDCYFSFYLKDGAYDFAQASIVAPSTANLINNYTVPQLIDYGGYTLDQIKALASYNRYVTASERLSKIGAPTSAAYSVFETTFTESGTLTPTAAISALTSSIIYPTTGYYYFHNLGTGRYAFSDENLDQDYLNDETLSAKHVWKVTADGTNVKIYALTGKGITSDKAIHSGDLALETAYANSFASGNGAFYVGCIQDPNAAAFTVEGSDNAYVSATNPMKIAHFNGDRNDTKAYWLFEAVDASDFDVYTVTFVNAPGNNYVTYGGSATTGNKTVYDGGVFFMTKDASITASDFTAESVTNYEAAITISENVITVTYTVTDWNALITTYISDHSLATLPAGAVGYPTNDSELIAAYIATMSTKNAASYNALKSAYEAYLAETVIKMPTDGKVYTFTNVQTNGDEYYLNSASGTMSLKKTTDDGATATKYICHKVSDTEYAFISLDDWYWMIAPNNGGTSVLKSHDKYASLTLSRFYSNCTTDYTNSATAENTLGLFQIYGPRRNGIANYGSVALVSSSGTFDSSGGAYFNESYSSAYRITEVASDYYNKVTLTSDGTDAYASIYLPFAAIIPDGITAYAVTSQSTESVHLTEIVTGGTLPTNTAAILKKDGQTSNADIYLSPATDTGSYDGENLLNGTVETVTRASLGTGSTYVLGNISGIGLYNYTGTNLAKGKAYLFVAGGGAKALSFDFEETSVSSVTSKSVSKQSIYNLAGQRLNKLQRGINIVNGKVVFIK